MEREKEGLRSKDPKEGMSQRIKEKGMVEREEELFPSFRIRQFSFCTLGCMREFLPLIIPLRGELPAPQCSTGSVFQPPRSHLGSFQILHQTEAL